MKEEKKSAADEKTKPPECKGQKFGHRFGAAGSNCARCGVNQNDLSGRRFRRFANAFRGKESEVESRKGGVKT